MIEISPAISPGLSYLIQKEVRDAERTHSKLDATGLNKLKHLMGGDIIRNEKNYFLEFSENFTERCPEWKHENLHDESTLGAKRIRDSGGVVNLFWSKYTFKEKEEMLIIRKQQNSGPCYLHGPVVLEHYLVSIASGCKITSSIDVGKCNNFLLRGDKLANFLVNDEGGDSEDTLLNICNLSHCDKKNFSIPDVIDLPDVYIGICNRVLNYVADQPALVSQFKVHKDFQSSNLVSFTGSPDSGNEVIRHAMHCMVLVGARKSLKGEYFFLLQNWWDGKYFVEVTGEYMHNCGAMITFITEPVTRRDELMSIQCEALYAETCADARETIYER